MKLMTYELEKLAHFVLQMPEERARILADACNDPKTGGPLITAYRAVLAVV